MSWMVPVDGLLSLKSSEMEHSRMEQNGLETFFKFDTSLTLCPEKLFDTEKTIQNAC